MKSLFLPVSFVPKIIFSKGIRKVIQTSETNLTHRYENRSKVKLKVYIFQYFNSNSSYKKECRENWLRKGQASFH